MSKPIKQRQFFPGQPEAVLPVYVESMTLQQVRCFGEKQTLNFTKPDGSIAQWTVILGENGVGKTTVLQCLAGMQPTKSRSDEHDPRTCVLLPQFDRVFSFVKLIHLHRAFLGQGIGGGDKSPALSVELKTRLELMDVTSANEALFAWSYSSELKAERGMSGELTGNHPEKLAGLHFYAYGASRRMAVQGRKSFDFEGADESKTLFNNESELSNAEEWLLDLDNLVGRSVGRSAKQIVLKRLRDTLELLPHVLPMVHEVDFEVDPIRGERVRVKFLTDHGWLPIESLSYGYQTMISWIVDFTRRMYDRYPDAKDPIAMPAIVLVDEIDLHLHPKWQRELMGFLSKRFPKTQFIVTAHSPLIIQSEEVANVILLQRDPNKPDQVIVRQDDVAEIRKWRLDQILTSDLYGLESATAPEIKSKEERRSALLRKARRTPKDEAELAAIEEALSKLPAFSSREAVRAEQQFQETTALLAEAEKLVAKPKAKARKK